MLTELRFEKGLADLASDGRGKCPQVFLARTYKNRGLDRAQKVIHGIMVIYL